MDFIRRNTVKPEVHDENSMKIQRAETGWMNAKKTIDDAIYELGKMYYEANKDNKESDYAGQIAKINEKIKDEYIWHQYRLSLDGQRMCDSCKSFITADSAFCNRCGAAVAPIDFSSVSGMTDAADNINADGVEEKAGCCPKCGKKLIEGASFCEGCGTRIV